MLELGVKSAVAHHSRAWALDAVVRDYRGAHRSYVACRVAALEEQLPSLQVRPGCRLLTQRLHGLHPYGGALQWGKLGSLVAERPCMLRRKLTHQSTRRAAAAAAIHPPAGSVCLRRRALRVSGGAGSNHSGA